MTPHSEDAGNDAAVQADHYLRAAATILRAPLTRTVYLTEISDAIEHLCRAAIATPGFPGMDDRVRATFPDLIFAMAADLVERVGRKMTGARIYLGMGAASGLITAGHSDLTWDRILHARQFAAELRALAYRREINERGDPLMRSIMISIAADAMPQPGQTLH